MTRSLCIILALAATSAYASEPGAAPSLYSDVVEIPLQPSVDAPALDLPVLPSPPDSFEPGGQSAVAPETGESEVAAFHAAMANAERGAASQSEETVVMQAPVVPDPVVEEKKTQVADPVLAAPAPPVQDVSVAAPAVVAPLTAAPPVTAPPVPVETPPPVAVAPLAIPGPVSPPQGTVAPERPFTPAPSAPVVAAPVVAAPVVAASEESTVAPVLPAPPAVAPIPESPTAVNAAAAAASSVEDATDETLSHRDRRRALRHEEGVDEEENPRRLQNTVFGSRKHTRAFGAWAGASLGAPVLGGPSSGALDFGFLLGGSLRLGAEIRGLSYKIGGPDVRLASSGFLVGWTFKTRSIIHPTAEMVLGGGLVRRTSGEMLGVVGMTAVRGGVELNLMRSVRLAATVGWRGIAVSDAQVRRDLDGFEGLVSLRVGWF